MSQWNVLEHIWKYSREKILLDGNSWDIHYDFILSAGATSILVFKFGITDEIHPNMREIRAVDTSTNVINLKVITLGSPTPDVLGTDISNKVFNSNLNKEHSFDFNMYDETSTLSDEGTVLPYSATMVGDKKSITTSFIEREYIAPVDGYIALKFVNQGSGELNIEYNAGGHSINIT